MRRHVQQHVLRYIAHEWTHLPVGTRPWGAWIGLFETLAPTTDCILAHPVASALRTAWFLDERGVFERDVWEFARFWAVQIERPWFGGTYGPSRPKPSADDDLPLRRATFALIEGESAIHVETMWAPLYGAGQRVILNTRGQVQTSGSRRI